MDDADRREDAASRAIFAVMYPYSLGHDYDSEFDNRRGEYMGIPVPSRVDKCREAARAALAPQPREDEA